MAVALFIVWIVVAFIGMELISYVLHRWVFHGILWKIHISHHIATRGRFEANDLFAVFFASVAIVLMAVGVWDPLGSPAFPLGLGMTIYGFLYFIVHDLATHKRFLPLRVRTGWIDVVRRAHLKHHQRADKPGQEPFGLFLFPYSEFRGAKSKDASTRTKDA